MSELLKKELRGLRPMILLMVGFFGIIFIYSFMDEFPDVVRVESQKSASMGALAMLGLFSAMTGAGLLVGESGEGTMHFLDALPLSRTRIFFAKLIAGVAVLLLTPLMIFGLDVLSLLMSHQSTSPPFPWRGEALCLLQQSIVSIYLLSVVVMLSFTRQWFTLVLGFVVWGFLWLRVRDVAWTALFDPNELLVSAYAQHGRFAWRHAGVELGVSAGALVVAWFCFQSLGDRIQHAADRASRRRVTDVLRYIGVGLVPVVWIAVVYILVKASLRHEPAMGKKGAAESKFFSTQQTKRFDFVFRENQRGQAQDLIAKADGIHDRVTAFLGANPVPGRIVVDLGSPVVQHAAGQTNWTKIRIPLALGLSLHQLQAVLGHETTHVYIEQLGGGALLRHFDSARFFHEGLATWIELQFFSTPEECQKMRRLAAVASARERVPFEKLTKNETFSKERDGNLVYPLGEMFCQALVATYGKGAPGKLIRACARPDAPSGIEEVAFWRDAMQACGFDLERVIAAYDTEVDRAVKAEAEFIAQFPKLTARVEVVGGDILIRPEFKGAPPGKIVCMVDGALNPKMIAVNESGAFRIPSSQHPGLKLRYLLGWRTPDLPMPVYEAWAEIGL